MLKNRLSFFLQFILTPIIGVMGFFYISLGPRIFNLNQSQLDHSGDGLKNYFTFAYHYKYLEGIHFSGFMYPYGDLTFFADSQMGLIWIFWGLQKVGIDISDHLLGTINFLTIGSFVLAAYCFIVILRKYIGHTWYVVIAAILCVVLSPQVWRVQSHYALAYAFIFPLLWIWSRRICVADKTSEATLPSLFIMLTLLYSAFLHPYYLVINALFILALGVFYLRDKMLTSIHLFASTTVPLIMFLVINSWLDPMTDRPKNPYGIFAYQTDLVDLMPFSGTLHGFLQNSLSFNLRTSYAEGYCYITMLPIIVVALLLVKRFILPRRWNFKLELPSFLQKSFFAGLLCLLVAMGFHLDLTFNYIIDVLPSLKQFRGLGRFSWPFYYVTFTVSAVIIYKVVKNIPSVKVRYGLLSIVLFLLVLDAVDYHKAFRKNIDTYAITDLLNGDRAIETLLSDAQRQLEYDAILTLPQSTEGGEKFNLAPEYHLKTRVLPYSFQTGIPSTTSIMSRVPISTTLNLLKMSSSVYSQKPNQKTSLIDTTQFLVVIPPDYVTDYQDILDKATFIGRTKKIELYTIHGSDLNRRECYPITESSIDLAEAVHYESDSSFFSFEDFGDWKNTGVDDREGTYYSDKGQNVMFDVTLTQQITCSVEMSFWFKLCIDDSTVPSFDLALYNDQDEVISKQHFRDWDMRRVEAYDDWVRFYRTFDINTETKRIVVTKVSGEHIFVDNLLLKSRNLNVHYMLDNVEYYADHLMVERCK